MKVPFEEVLARPIFSFMDIFITLVIGLVVGAVAKLLMPGRDPGGIFVTMLLGVGGSLLAGVLGRSLGVFRSPAEGPGILASVLGAVLLLFFYRVVTRTTTRRA